jgi:hypothetical protein
MARDTGLSHAALFVGLVDIFISNSFWSCTLKIERETEKALLLKSSENGRAAWFPKSALVPPASPGLWRERDQNEFAIAPWFRRKLTRTHELVLGERE